MTRCGIKTIEDMSAYRKYIFNPEHGLVQTREVSGLVYKVNYLPGAYLAYNTCEGLSGLSGRGKDSIVSSYGQSLTFLLNIGPAKNEDVDITRLGVANYEEFANRLEQMAFKAGDWITLRVGEKEYRPAIVRMENINAQERSRNFMVVFESSEAFKKDLDLGDWTFIYNDALFETGINKFLFRKKDIDALPEFIF
ncbi:MAG: hypothetical protein QM534_14030 [Sediminibacterium sp.]|nr:hypothetical protein [Sediminibacterium sp.]